MHPSILKRFAPLIFSLGITSVCLFGSAGRLDWSNAWFLLGLNFAASLASSILLWRNPELLAERSNIKAGKSWDKVIAGFVVLLADSGPRRTEFRGEAEQSSGLIPNTIPGGRRTGFRAETEHFSACPGIVFDLPRNDFHR